MDCRHSNVLHDLYTYGTTTHSKSHDMQVRQHVAAVVLPNNTTIFGVNSSRLCRPGSPYTEHAETNVIKKLRCTPKDNKRRRLYIDLISIRLSNHGTLKCAKPCVICVRNMLMIQKTGYVIKKIYYSTNEGTIMCTTLNELQKAENKYVTVRSTCKF